MSATSSATCAESSTTRHLSGYLRDLYQQPKVADTVNFNHIKRHYYRTHVTINPTRIVPVGPQMNLAAPHGREAFDTAS